MEEKLWIKASNGRVCALGADIKNCSWAKIRALNNTLRWFDGDSTDVYCWYRNGVVFRIPDFPRNQFRLVAPDRVRVKLNRKGNNHGVCDLIRRYHNTRIVEVELLPNFNKPFAEKVIKLIASVSNAEIVIIRASDLTFDALGHLKGCKAKDITLLSDDEAFVYVSREHFPNLEELCVPDSAVLDPTIERMQLPNRFVITELRFGRVSEVTYRDTYDETAIRKAAAEILEYGLADHVTLRKWKTGPSLGLFAKLIARPIVNDLRRGVSLDVFPDEKDTSWLGSVVRTHWKECTIVPDGARFIETLTALNSAIMGLLKIPDTCEIGRFLVGRQRNDDGVMHWQLWKTGSVEIQALEINEKLPAICEGLRSMMPLMDENRQRIRRRIQILNWKTAHDSHRDAAIAIRAATERPNLPLEFHKRFVLGRNALSLGKIRFMRKQTTVDSIRRALAEEIEWLESMIKPESNTRLEPVPREWNCVVS